MRPTTQMHTLALLVAALFSQAAQAQDSENAAEAGNNAPSAQLETIRVKGKRNTKPAVERKNREAIDTEMIRDSRDLVRYSTDVGIADNGRHLKGFAMRGVEANRVGISIDGIALPEFEQNSLYARYGNFNSSRMSIDPELVRTIDVVKGADSFNSGSGSLGGGVNYRSLNAQDMIQDDKRFGGLIRSGYATKNREWVNTAGIGFVGENWDGALLWSHRRGHEMKSKGRGEDTWGSSRGIPDPSKHKHNSYLAKIGWQITPSHKIGFNINGQDGDNFTYEYSYALYRGAWRNTNDESKRLGANLYHEWTPESRYLASVKTELDYQRTDLAAVNYKGSRHWLTDEPKLDEIYDRRMLTDFKRLTTRLDSQPLHFWGGEHNLSFKAFAGRRDFKNTNHDTVGIGTNWQATITDTIQYPTKTTSYGFSFLNRSQWNDTWSSSAGIRFDQEKVVPKELHVPCIPACTAAGKPEGNTFRNWNGTLGLDARLNSAWKLGYQIGTGHRVPTASEMYFTFIHPAGNWLANPDLKAERSLNQTLSLQGQGDKGYLDLSLYHSRYKNFLVESDTAQIEQGRLQLYQQMVNLDQARISGVEFKGELNLNKVTPVPEGWKLFGAVGYSKGSSSGDASLLSIQPLKAIIGLDYEQPDGKWGIFSRLTYAGAKKAKDAKVINHDSECTRSVFVPDPWFPGGGYTQCLERKIVTSIDPYPWLNKSVTLLDVYGYYKPKKNLTIRAGAYNLFDRKYHTWDSLRGINRHSTTNTIDREGKGLERFYAPGRNYAVSLEYKF